MSETPSNRRRKGRNEFEPGVDPMDIQPYKEGTWGYQMNLKDWLDGWKEAEEAYLEQEEEKPEICPCCGREICPCCNSAKEVV
jgi:hypothetical protein